MIVCITGHFDVYDDSGHKTGKKEFVVSHGIDIDTGKTVIMPNEHPQKLGAVFSPTLGEWIIRK